MSTPLFEDFTEKVKDLFKLKKYDLGQQVEIKGKSGAASWSSKATLGNGQVKPELKVKTKTEFAEFEVSENVAKGLLSVEIEKTKAVRGIDMDFTAKSNGCVELEGVYQPKDSFWNVKALGTYKPAGSGNRVCKTTLSAAVGDEELGLCVGGEVEFVDKGKVNSPPIEGYSLGFLYDTNSKGSYSLTFAPQPGGALEYSLTCYHKFHERCQIAARAQGLADYSVNGVEAPVVTVAGQWKLDNCKMQAFYNTQREFGATYKLPVNDNISLQLGCASVVNTNTNGLDTKFGYKLSIE